MLFGANLLNTPLYKLEEYNKNILKRRKSSYDYKEIINFNNEFTWIS